MTVRPLTPADAPAVEALTRAAFHDAYATCAEISAGVGSVDEKAADVLRELRAALPGEGKPLPEPLQPQAPPGEGKPLPGPLQPQALPGGALRFLGALDAGRLLGLALVRDDARGRLWLDDLFVAADARGRGVARALLEAALPAAREVLCEVNARNGTALAAFQALGFTRLSETVVLRRAGA